jgi:hypothetical protein
MPDLVFHDTYFVWSWRLNALLVLVTIVLLLAAAALIRYLFFR